MKTLELPLEWRGRAIVIAGGKPDPSWFTDDELRTANGFRLPKRRHEWMLSRAAAKKLAVERGLCGSWRELVVTRPRTSALHVSLSHSEPYAAAAVDLDPIGIDVQTVRELRDAAAHFFLTDDETDAMRSCSTADRLIHFWAAKEAAWKRHEGAIETLKRVPLHLEDYGADWVRFDTVETIRMGDVVVALTRPTS